MLASASAVKARVAFLARVLIRRLKAVNLIHQKMAAMLQANR